jgi:hypothetical protein
MRRSCGGDRPAADSLIGLRLISPLRLIRQRAGRQPGQQTRMEHRACRSPLQACGMASEGELKRGGRRGHACHRAPTAERPGWASVVAPVMIPSPSGKAFCAALS